MRENLLKKAINAILSETEMKNLSGKPESFVIYLNAYAAIQNVRKMHFAVMASV